MPRLVFFGMNGIFSVAPLERLVKAGIEICAVIVPVAWPTAESLPRRVEPPIPSEHNLPIINPYLDHNIIHIAWEYEIPVWEVGAVATIKSLRLLADLQPDLISVACFPYIFSKDLLALPQYGCLNLHPSLLPAYRGPTPLFWMARNYERRAGVTLHFLEKDVDAGDIVSQTSFDWSEGISGVELEYRCSVEGAKLLLEAVRILNQESDLPRRSQPEEGATYFSHPVEEDFLIPTDWAVRRVFNFLRAAEGWPLIIDLGAERFFVRKAINYKLNQKFVQPYIRYNDQVWIQFRDGVLKIQI